MDRYQYQTIQVDISELGKPELATRLDTLGREGWALVSTVSHERHGHSREVFMFFSRRAPE